MVSIQFQQLHPFSSAQAKHHPKWCWGRSQGWAYTPRTRNTPNVSTCLCHQKHPKKKKESWRFWTMCQNQIQITLFWISAAMLSFPVSEEWVCTWRRVNRNYEKPDAWNTKLQNANSSAFGSKGVLSAFSLFQILAFLDTQNKRLFKRLL